MYIVKSGDGCVLHAGTLEMIGNQKNPSDALMCAARMPFDKACEVRDRMIGKGIDAELIELRFGRRVR